MNDITQMNWIKEQFETPGAMNFTKDEKILIMERLTRATG